MPEGYDIRRDGDGYRWFRKNRYGDVLNVGILCEDQVDAIVGAWRHFFVEVGTNASADTVIDVMRRWVRTRPTEIVKQCPTCEQADKLKQQAEENLTKALEQLAVESL